MEGHEGPQREAWKRAFASAGERARRLFDGLSREQMNFHPGPDAWSVAECLDHLAVAMRLYLDPLEEALAESQPSAGGNPGSIGDPGHSGPWLGRILVRSLRAPGKRFPAPRSFRPREGDIDPAEVCDSFEAALGRMLAALEGFADRPVGAVRMSWPVFGLVKLSVAQAFELQALHLGRHLDQAERVTSHPGFP